MNKNLSLVALALASGLALTSCAPAEKPQPEPAAVEEAPKAPNYASTILHGDDLTREFEIPAGLADQELAETFVSRFIDWKNYGANPELREELYAQNLSDEQQLEVYADLAKKNAESITPALFGEGWQDNLIISQFAKQVEQNNRVTLDLSVITGNTEYDKEPWTTWAEDVVALNKTNEFTLEGGRRLRMEFTVKDNSDKNRVDELTQTEQYPKEGVFTVVEATFMEVNGKEVAVELDFGEHLYE